LNLKFEKKKNYFRKCIEMKLLKQVPHSNLGYFLEPIYLQHMVILHLIDVDDASKVSTTFKFEWTFILIYFALLSTYFCNVGATGITFRSHAFFLDPLFYLKNKLLHKFQFEVLNHNIFQFSNGINDPIRNQYFAHFLVYKWITYGSLYSVFLFSLKLQIAFQSRHTKQHKEPKLRVGRRLYNVFTLQAFINPIKFLTYCYL
jgi:hypothetical protein